MKTWGHRIDLIGPTARAWLQCGPRCRYLLRYIEAKGNRRVVTRTVQRPLTAPTARKLAVKLGLSLPDADISDPFASPQMAGTAASA
jgi:hypothetical protein